jgi:hypothetical protein
MLLKDARPPGFEESRFELYQAKDLIAHMDEGVSLYLYRVAPNITRRHLPSRIDSQGHKLRPPLPLDLFYMLTPWARTAEKQHLILAWAMRALEDTPTLPSGLLNHAGGGEDAFYPDETVDLVYEPTTLGDLYDIWQPSLPHMQVSVTYVARMVPIDSTIDLTEYPAAQTREFGMGKPKP